MPVSAPGLFANMYRQARYLQCKLIERAAKQIMKPKDN